MDKFLAVFAIIILTGFIGILMYSVPRIDLGIVCAITIGLAAYDFYRKFKES